MKPEYARTTITVPWQLKKKMKQAGGRVNWSAIACEAFEEKLEELGPVQEITSIEDAVERMRSIATEKSETFEEGLQEGKDTGRHWALNIALPEQLKRIEKLKQNIDEKDNVQWDEFLLKPHARVQLAIQIGLGQEFGQEFGQGFGEEFPRGRGPRGGHHRRRRRGPRGHGHGGGGEGGRGRSRKRMPGGSCDEGRDGELGSERPADNEGGPDRERLRMERQYEARMIWRSILHQRPSHPSFFAGFAQAALEVWDELKDKLG